MTTRTQLSLGVCALLVPGRVLGRNAPHERSVDGSTAVASDCEKQPWATEAFLSAGADCGHARIELFPLP